MSKTLEKLPEDIQGIIFQYAYKCKKEQNFYLNKELTSMILSLLDKCECCFVFKRPICKDCDKIAFNWISGWNYMGCYMF